MAEPLIIRLKGDSSELRNDIDKNIKKMQEMSDKYQAIQKQLENRNTKDFAKVLSKNLEKVNAELDKANAKLAKTEKAYDKQAQKTQEMVKNGASDEELAPEYEKLEQLQNNMSQAKANVVELEQKQAEITAKTTQEYNAQTEALKQQANEIKNNFDILDAINNQDMKDLKFAKLGEGLEKFKSGIKGIGSFFTGVFQKSKNWFSSLFSSDKIKSTTSQFKGLTGMATKFGLALFGAQTAFTLIKKAVSQILEENTKLANTVNSLWNGLVSLISPIVDTIVSTLATALNYVLAMVNLISGLDVLGIMNKANKKANAKKSSGSSKQSQQYSFDTAETLQKNESGSSGTSIEDSYLKNVKLSGELLKYANKLKAIWGDIQKIGSNLWQGIKDGLKYMNSGQRILQVCKNLIDTFLDDIKACTEATVEWSANLDFGPLFDGIATVMESLKPIITSIGDAFVWIYENAILPISKWFIENGIAEFLQTISSMLDVVNTVIEQMKEPLRYVWDNFISPLASSIGDTLISVMQTIQDYMDKLGKWLTDHPEFVEFVTILGSIVGITLAIVAGFGLVTAAVGIFAEALASSITWVIAIIAAIILLLEYFGNIDEAIGNLKLMFQGIIDFITGVFAGDWEQAWNGIKELFEGFVGLIGNILDALKNAFQALVQWIGSKLSDAWNKAWTGIKNIFKNLWNGILDLLERAMNWIVDKLNSLSFDVPDWVPVVGGKHFGFGISKVSIPRLAKGAVIPPNKEFLAVLGDQTRGKNIETPESLLREIVQEESGGSQDINIVANGDMAQLIKLLRFKLQEEDKRVGSSLVVGG